MANQALATEDNVGYAPLDLEQFEPIIKACISDVHKVIDKIKHEASHTWNNVIQPLEEAEEQLHHVWGLLAYLNAVENTPQVRAVYDEILPLISSLHTEVAQDADLYEIYLNIKNSSGFSKLADSQQAIISHALRDFKLAGVDLPQAQRHEFKQLIQSLDELQNTFDYNSLDATEGWTYHITQSQANLLEGLPEHTLESAAQRARAQELTGWVLTLDVPTYFAVVRYAHERRLREEFYAAYYTRASNQGPMAGNWDNTPVIADILRKRQKLAQLVGFKNYVEYSLATKMAENGDQVKKFLLDLNEKVRPRAQVEMEELQKFAASLGFAEPLAAWDVAYYSELQRKALYDLNEEELRPYFVLPKVLAGIFKLVKNIYGLHVSEIFEFAKWHPSVRLFKVQDASHSLRGYIYMDLFTREGKQGGACVGECLDRMRFSDEKLQYPSAYLTCNFAPPINEQPALLTHDDVLTLFHEFGHALHHVLTLVEHRSAAGMHGVEWDAVELPSQFMENWGWEWQVISDITEHVTTKQPLPRAMYDKMLAARNFHSGLHLARQLEYSLFDLMVHEVVGFDDKLTAHDIANQVRNIVCVTPVAEFNRFENTFAHIFGGEYAAGYYSYLWAEVLSCEAFDKFKAAGTFDAHTGSHFMQKILEKGGSKPAMELFIAFAGRKPSIDALLRHHGVM